MVVPGSLRSSGLRRAALGAAIAGLGTCALTGYTWWSARGGVPSPDVSAVMLILIPIGVTAGLISGRFRDALGSWVAAVIGSMVAYMATGTIDPGLPAPDSGFAGNELLNAAFLLPFIAGGHLLGTWAGFAKWRGVFGPAIAGLGTCVYAGFGYWNLTDGASIPSGSPALMIWIAMAIWIAIGATAGLISGRFRDAPASGAAAMIGFLLAYLAYLVYRMEPGGAAPVESLAYTPVVLLPFIAGGHLLGAWARVANRAPGGFGARG